LFATRLVAEAELIDSENKFYATSQEEMKEFRTFYNRILLASTTGSNY